MRTYARIAPLLVVALAGCLGEAGTETGNPPLAAIELALVAPDVPVAGALTADPATGVRVDEVWISVAQVKFVAASGASCAEPDEAASDVEPGVVAEVAARENLFPLALPAGDYCRVRVRLQRATQAPAEAPSLLDQAVVVRGVRGDGVPFTIRSRALASVDLRAKHAPFPLGEATGALLLAFDARAWVAAVDLDALTPIAGGIVVDEGENRERLTDFDRALARGLSLHADRDGDRRLSTDEAAPLADPR